MKSIIILIIEVFRLHLLNSMSYDFGRISGCHFNPAVRMPMLLKKITLNKCVYYIAAQIIGSLFVGLCNNGILENLDGNSVFGGKVGLLQLFFIEIILTFGLVFVIFTSIIKANNF